MAAEVIVIVGETASGKSSLAMELAKKFGGEIICADSWTVYKGFDIGTAKPTYADQKLIPHHLLDVADPLKGFSAAEFKRRAESAIADIQKRAKLPIVVGGTGLYVDSLLFDYSFMPAGDSARRQLLNAQTLEQLMKEIRAKKIDVTGIDLGNKRRLIRLIESDGKRPTSQKLRENCLILGLKVDSEELKKRIQKRVKGMFEIGLENEVRQLAKGYGWGVEPMKGIGYREWRAYFEGGQTLAETKQQIISSTNGLAKKQRTWFKRNKYIQWIDDPRQAVALVTTFLNT